MRKPLRSSFNEPLTLLMDKYDITKLREIFHVSLRALEMDGTSDGNDVNLTRELYY